MSTVIWSISCLRADSSFVPSQWETSLQSNVVSHWLGANLESTLYLLMPKWESWHSVTLCVEWHPEQFLWTCLQWKAIGPIDDKSTLSEVMAWCHKAASHYLNQCWPRSISPYGVTRPRWFKCKFLQGQHMKCFKYKVFTGNIDGLVQNCSNSIAYTVELLQSYTKSSIWTCKESKHKKESTVKFVLS